MSTLHRQRGSGGQGGHEPRARIRLREARVLELSVRGWSQAQIADDLGVTQAAVSKILARLDRRQLREQAETVGRQKAQQSRQLDHLYAQAIGAWDASRTDSTVRRQRQTHAAGGAGTTVAEIVTEPQHGDPRYLAEARKALADRRKLWGLDAPQQVDVRASRNPYDGLTDDALREELGRQTRLLGESPAAPTVRAPAEARTVTRQESVDADEE
jgi:DNA-binding CsgD family transcriptional regulator